MSVETLLRAILTNQVAIMIALSRAPEMPLTLGEDLRACARATRELLNFPAPGSFEDQNTADLVDAAIKLLGLHHAADRRQGLDDPGVELQRLDYMIAACSRHRER